jgi:hypothetical protein
MNDKYKLFIYTMFYGAIFLDALYFSNRLILGNKSPVFFTISYTPVTLILIFNLISERKLINEFDYITKRIMTIWGLLYIFIGISALCKIITL